MITNLMGRKQDGKIGDVYENMVKEEFKNEADAKQKLDESKDEIVFESVTTPDSKGFSGVEFNYQQKGYYPIIFSKSLKKYEDEIVEFTKQLVARGVEL